MSQPVLMAVRGAAVMLTVSLPVAAVIGYYLGVSGVASFAYGVLVGMLTFASIGVTVSLVLGKTSQLKVLVGAGVYVGRILFAAAAVLVPIFAGWFPVMPMLGGLVLVYIVESVVLLVEASRFMSRGGFLGESGGGEDEVAGEDVMSGVSATGAERVEKIRMEG